MIDGGALGAERRGGQRPRPPMVSAAEAVAARGHHGREIGNREDCPILLAVTCATNNPSARGSITLHFNGWKSWGNVNHSYGISCIQAAGKSD